jgi:hypothetical protein
MAHEHLACAQFKTFLKCTIMHMDYYEPLHEMLAQDEEPAAKADKG